MTAPRKLPLWTCHKVVGAFQIASMAHQTDGAMLHANAAEVIAPVHVSAHWLGHHNPQVGGYFVQYEDGYTSYSPRQAFEAGYVRQVPQDIDAGNNTASARSAHAETGNEGSN